MIEKLLATQSAISIFISSFFADIIIALLPLFGAGTKESIDPKLSFAILFDTLFLISFLVILN